MFSSSVSFHTTFSDLFDKYFFIEEMSNKCLKINTNLGYEILNIENEFEVWRIIHVES